MKAFIIATALLAAISLHSSAAPSSSGSGKRIVCYFGSWAVYRYGAAKISENEIEPGLCDYFIYTFVGLDESTAGVRLLDAWNDVGDEWHRGLMTVLRNKAHAQGTKFLVAIGGWNEGSESYSKVVGNPTKRATLVQNIVKFVETYELDGFDLDWEYPAQRGGAPGDKAAYSALVSELRAEFDPRGWVLTAAVSANALTIGQSYDIPLLSEKLDMINVMAYDLHGSWESVTGHNAPLYARSTDYPDNSHLSVEAAMKAWISMGASPAKLNLGIGAYGRSFTLQNPAQTGIGAPAQGIAPAGWTNEAGFIGYDEICSKNGSVWTTAWDNEQQVPYAYSGNKWVGYDDVASIRLKICLANELNLGGALFWSIETDDFRGNCGNGKYPLIRAIGDAFADTTCGGSGYQPPIATKAPDSTTKAPDTTNAPTSAPTSSAPEATTSSPETTPPQSGGKVVCNAVGDRIRDPNDCASFFYCGPGPAGSITANKVICGTGLLYDPAILGCNHAVNVAC